MRSLKHDIEVRVRMLIGGISDRVEMHIDRSQVDENGADPVERVYLSTMLPIDTLLRPLILRYKAMKLG